MLHKGAIFTALGLLLNTLAFLTLSACSTAKQGLEVPGCQVEECVALGSTQQVWQGVKVTPLEVIEDSRCPIEAECVWEGRLLLKAQLDLGHESIFVDLDSAKPHRINGGFLSIVEIAPEMSAAWAPINGADYRIAFQFAPDTMQKSGE